MSFPSDTEVVTGVSQTIAFLNNRTELIASATALGMQKCMKAIKILADYYCPKDTLALVNSGSIDFYGYGFSAKGFITYGGPEAPYALWVHEDLTKYHEPPTAAKWLERAYREMVPDLEAIMKGELTGKTTPYRDYTHASPAIEG